MSGARFEHAARARLYPPAVGTAGDDAVFADHLDTQFGITTCNDAIPGRRPKLLRRGSWSLLSLPSRERCPVRGRIRLSDSEKGLTVAPDETLWRLPIVVPGCLDRGPDDVRREVWSLAVDRVARLVRDDVKGTEPVGPVPPHPAPAVLHRFQRQRPVPRVRRVTQASTVRRGQQHHGSRWDTPEEIRRPIRFCCALARTQSRRLPSRLRFGATRPDPGNR